MFILFAKVKSCLNIRLIPTFLKRCFIHANTHKYACMCCAAVKLQGRHEKKKSLNKLFVSCPIREDMEKVNINFHNNGTVSYQHKKILTFVPEMSKDGELRVLVPNIPLLVSPN